MTTTSTMKRAKGIAMKLTRPVTCALLLLLAYTLGALFATNPALQSSSYSSPAISKLANLPNQLDHFRVINTRCAEKPIDPDQVRRTLIDRFFDGESPYANFPSPHVRGLIKEKRVKGWGSNGAVFENLLREVKPRTIIEVGTFLGASAIHVANLTRRLGLGAAQIVCVDDFRGWPGFRDKFRDIPAVNGDVMLYHQFVQNVVGSNFTETIIPLPFSSASALDALCELGVRGDLIEIDAGHDFVSAWSDISRAHRILSPGGVLFGHDYFSAVADRGVKRAVNLFARLHGFTVKIDGQHWVIRPS